MAQQLSKKKLSASVPCPERSSLTVVLLVILFVPFTYFFSAGGIVLWDTPLSDVDHSIRTYLLTTRAVPEAQGLSSQEISRLYDVKKIIWLSSIFFLGMLITGIVFARMFCNSVCKGIFYGSIIALVLLSIIFSFSFNSFFIGFHELLFPQGNWQFAQDSVLIQAYPELFWQREAVQCAVLIAIQAVFGIVAAQLCLRKSQLRVIDSN